MNAIKLWQVNVDNHIYNATSDEIIQKIKKGVILRQDTVKASNLSWIEIGDIPEFDEIFKEELWKLHLSTPTETEVKEVYTHFQVGRAKQKEYLDESLSKLKSCFIHPTLPPFYKCTCCENLFCKTCPQSNEAKEIICPMCGGLCEPLSTKLWTMPKAVKEATYQIYEEPNAIPLESEITYAKLTVADFLEALAYPLRFPFSLSVGGGIFSTLVFGVFITTFRGDWTFWISLLLISLILMFKFGVLTKTYEVFLRKDLNKGFLPRLNKYTFWEDFINPLFTGLGTFIVSFGLFLVVSIFVGIMAWFNFSSNVNNIEKEMLTAGENLNFAIQNSETANQIKTVEKYELRKMIDEMRMQQLESVFGHNHLVENENLERMFNSVIRLTLYYHLPVFLAFVLGVLYFPAVCLTAGNIHFVGRIHFTIGFNAMRKLGFDYLKILVLCFGLLAISFVVIKLLDFIFTKFEFPLAGVFSAITVGSFLIFYFWIAFSSILAITATKNIKA